MTEEHARPFPLIDRYPFIMNRDSDDSDEEARFEAELDAVSAAEPCKPADYPEYQAALAILLGIWRENAVPFDARAAANYLNDVFGDERFSEHACEEDDLLRLVLAHVDGAEFGSGLLGEWELRVEHGLCWFHQDSVTLVEQFALDLAEDQPGQSHTERETKIAEFRTYLRGKAKRMKRMAWAFEQQADAALRGVAQ